MFWIVDYKTDSQGSLRPVIIGGRAFPNELLAQKYIDEANLSRKAEVFDLPTTDISKATQMVKAKLIKRYKSLDEGMKRAYHK